MLVKPYPAYRGGGQTVLVPDARGQDGVEGWSDSPTASSHVACPSGGSASIYMFLCSLWTQIFMKVGGIYLHLHVWWPWWKIHSSSSYINLYCLVSKDQHNARYLGLALRKWQHLPSWDWHFGGFKGKQHLFLRDLGKADDLEIYQRQQ